MDIERKIELVKRAPTQEIITEGELRSVFENYSHPKHYIGFEISGMVHLGTGLCTALKVKDLLEAGVKPTIFLADYHAWINGKLGGDLEKIQKVAKGYFKSAFVSLGLDEGKVEYVLASEIYDRDYWKDVLAISKETTIARMLRCTTIMGRTSKDATDSAAILYPAMQAADIWKLDVQIAHAGMDQRKVHMLSREVSEKSKKKKIVAVHGKLLTGLQGPARMETNAPINVDALNAGIEAGGRKLREMTKSDKGGYIEMLARANQLDAAEELRDSAMISSKMSKSKPDTAIFIHDSEEEIKRKISKAYCPEKIVEGNPVIDILEYLVMHEPEKTLLVSRPAKFGGDAEFASAAEVKKTFLEGKLHPMDLKAAVGGELAAMLKPSRDYFLKRKELIESVAAK
jgi:tyrosyl-tRNA synthetase